MSTQNSTSATQTRYARNTFWAALVLFAAACFNDVVAIVQASRSGAWQAWAEVATISAFVTITVFSAILSRRQRLNWAIGLLIGGFVVTITVRNALTAGLGVVYGLTALTITTAVALYTLPRGPANRLVVASIFMGAFLVLFDLYVPPYRQPAPAPLLNSVPYVALAVSLLYIILVARQFRQLRLQARLTALVLITTIPLLIGVTAFISSRAGAIIEQQANHNLQDSRDTLAANVSTWLELHIRALKELSMLPDIVSMDGARQRPVLQAMATAYPNLFLVQTTDLNGINVARNDDSELKDYHDRGWYQGARSGAPITLEVLISRTTGKPALNLAAPIRDASGQVIGVGSIVSELDEISKEVLAATLGRGGYTYIVDPNNHVVAHPDPAFTENELRDLSDYPPVAALRQGENGLITFTDENGEAWRAYVGVLKNNWGVIAQQPEAELLEPVQGFQRVTTTLITVGAAVMLGLAWFTIRRTLQPIGVLTDAATAIAAGDLNRTADVKSQDEVGILAAAFNNMTAQLRDLINSLEQRVAERTRDLALSAEISRRLSSILDQKQLITEVVEQIRSTFNYYHVHVYLYDDRREYLVMAGGTRGAVTAMLSRGHRLEEGRGLVGRAAGTNSPVLVPDVSKDPGWLPNPLLPDTRSELAVPIAVGGRVLGVLDVQHNVVNGLKQDDVQLIQSIASQVAIALQNTQSFQQTQQQAQRETIINTITEKIQRAATVETVLEIAARELGQALGANRATIQVGPTTINTGDRNAKYSGQ